MTDLSAFRLDAWIEKHRGQLKPPVGNAEVFPGADFIVMIVGGPNQRKDFHVDPGPEFFYQLEGDMVLRVFDGGRVKDIPIKAGEVFMLPPLIPHSPQRVANTVGMVVERKRLAGELDGLRWYCEACHKVLYEEFFHLTDIARQLKPVIEKFHADELLRTCRHCNAVMQPPPPPKT